MIEPLVRARKRKRTTSSFDSKLRIALRNFEAQIKYRILSPLGFLLRPRKISLPLELDNVHSVLILRYDALGDAVLASPVWHTIKKYAPHIRVGVVGSYRNEMLLKTDPAIDDVFVFSRTLALRILRDLLRARQTKWDVVINIFFHDKTWGAIYSRFVAPSAITATIVRDHRDKYESLYSIVGNRPDINTPMIIQNLMALQTVIDVPITYEDTLPRLVVDRTIEMSFSHEIEEQLARAHQSKYIIINTDASQTYKEWGFENTFALSRLIAEQRPDLHVFWTSAPGRGIATRAFLDARQLHSIEYLSAPSVHHLLTAIKHSSVVITPDTSVVHIASAYGIPVIGLYIEKSEFLPYGTTSHVLYAQKGKPTASIAVEDVFNAFNEIYSLQGHMTLRALLQDQR
jgi:ADP-heptose:LPS heptosyltransferase